MVVNLDTSNASSNMGTDPNLLIGTGLSTF